MIVVDTSALIAIIRKEPERLAFLEQIRDDKAPLVSVITVLEATMGASRALERGAAHAVNEFVAELALREIPVTSEHVRAAQAAFFAFGKGQGGRSQLNFADCLIYALAKSLDAPLLFKGNDFIHTDVKRALT